MTNISDKQLAEMIIMNNPNLIIERNMTNDLRCLFFKNEKIMEQDYSGECNWLMSQKSMVDDDLEDILKLMDLLGGNDLLNDLSSEDTVEYDPEKGWSFDV